MEKKTILTMTALALAFGVILMPQASAFGPGFRGEGGGEECLVSKFLHKAHFLLEEKEALGLSEDQANTIHSLKMDVKKQLIRQGAEMELIGLDIKSKLYEKQVDVPGVQKLIDQKYEIKKALDKAALDAYAKLKTTLSEKQWADFKNLKKGKTGKHFGHEGRE